MRCLVVVAHPLEDSLCKSLADAAVARLKQRGHEVQVEDLYETGFGAALTAKERASYYGGMYDGSAVRDETARLLETEALVVVFPTWWFGFPAVLKGWFDRIWAPGVAYDHASDLGPIKPRLLGLKKTLAVTTLGASWWMDKLVLRQPVKRVLQIALLGACAPACTFQMLSLYNAERLSNDKVQDFQTRIEAVLDRW